ncbi:TolC family protein [Tautonia plasticadhaerens]|uniref:Outer membrane efflux protein n=1 Tax=Tautonia plasticadhaerens TaxID=2527974 RepID=A0A518GZI0_9BACT|nr:TolC family protein [Tautonia plasticadhaerens]QDV33994.1 Outer membrane efflux protein [Tautonia plasticadhaerens]
MQGLQAEDASRRGGPLLGWTIVAFATLLATGCSRYHYRERADLDVYAIQEQRRLDPRWSVPPRPVEAAALSRMADPDPPDAEPVPQDDPAARLFQVSRGRPFEFFGWRSRGSSPIEDLSWLEVLPRLPDGSVPLDQRTVMLLALVNSRDYQFAVEDLYLAGLGLTSARFEFMVQPFIGTIPAYLRSGGGINEVDRFTFDTNGLVRKQFYSGAQLLAQFTNALAFETSGGGIVNTATSVLTVTALQPLLRGGLTRIATQALSLEERGVLYALRDFSRFRRAFYVDTVAQGGYLGLLQQLQGIRNARENLEATARNLAETEALVAAGQAAPIQREQVAQQFQAAQLGLVSQEASLETALDFYRIGLGLPPELPVTLDDAPLRMFELSDPRLETLRDRNEALYLSLLQTDEAPPTGQLAEAAGALAAEFDELRAVLGDLTREFDAWRLSLGPIDPESGRLVPPPEGADPEAIRQFERAERAFDVLFGSDADRAPRREDRRPEILGEMAGLVQGIRGLPSSVFDEPDLGETRASSFLDAVADLGVRLRELGEPPLVGALGVAPRRVGVVDAIEGDILELAALREAIGSAPAEEVWEALRDLAGNEFRARYSDIFITQTQVRVYRIALTPVGLSVDRAIQIALANRLDLMNAKGQVTDAWRNVEVAANALKADLNLRYSGTLATDPGFDGIFRFDASASNHLFGLEYDAPLTRRLERNAYRASQITYQRARRAYMLTRDEVARQIRLDLRNLALTRRQFDIARESLLISARQLEEAEYTLRTSDEPNESVTLLLLNALSALLDAKNALIGNWVSYETARLTLYQDFDLMDIDERGVWTNELDLRTALAAGGDPGARSEDRLLGTDVVPPLPPLPGLVEEAEIP